MDDELDLVTHLDVEQHVADCAACGAARRSRLRLRDAIEKADLYVASPPQLRSQIASALRRETRSSFGASRWLLAAAACVLLAAGSAWLVFQIVIHHGAQNQLADQIIASHVRSLMAEHLADVISTDQHTVKPWFAGRIDFSPQVKDFSAQGFELVGGRLDYLDNRPVAAIVYRCRKHVINLFVWPGADHAGSISTLTRQGYNIEHWTAGGLSYWLISDLNRDELAGLERLLREP
jgi:anti-sigma factor RsiW